jgi:hypothetical protein
MADSQASTYNAVINAARNSLVSDALELERLLLNGLIPSPGEVIVWSSVGER